jgi:hypothetical protein
MGYNLNCRLGGGRRQTSKGFLPVTVDSFFWTFSACGYLKTSLSESLVCDKNLSSVSTWTDLQTYIHLNTTEIYKHIHPIYMFLTSRTVTRTPFLSRSSSFSSSVLVSVPPAVTTVIIGSGDSGDVEEVFAVEVLDGDSSMMESRSCPQCCPRASLT